MKLKRNRSNPNYIKKNSFSSKQSFPFNLFHFAPTGIPLTLQLLKNTWYVYHCYRRMLPQWNLYDLWLIQKSLSIYCHYELRQRKHEEFNLLQYELSAVCWKSVNALEKAASCHCLLSASCCNGTGEGIILSMTCQGYGRSLNYRWYSDSRRLAGGNPLWHYRNSTPYPVMG